MPIFNSSYHAVKYAELRIGSILKVCRFVIRHITQTETQTETEANFTHLFNMYLLPFYEQKRGKEFVRERCPDKSSTFYGHFYFVNFQVSVVDPEAV